MSLISRPYNATNVSILHDQINLDTLLRTLSTLPKDLVLSQGFSYGFATFSSPSQVQFSPATNVTVLSMLKHAVDILNETFRHPTTGATAKITRNTLVRIGAPDSPGVPLSLHTLNTLVSIALANRF